MPPGASFGTVDSPPSTSVGRGASGVPLHMASRSAFPPLGPTNPPWRHVVAVWGAFGVAYAGVWLMAAKSPWQEVWPWVFAGAFVVAACWALLTPIVFELARAVRPGRVGWVTSIAAHTVAAISCAAIVTMVRRLGISLVSDRPPIPFLSDFLFWFDVWLFVYLAVVAVGNALGLRRRFVDRTIRAHLLETQLARAQLQYLEIQLQPHFLFNALNSIQELAHESAEAAERMLRRLRALLSISLDRSGQDEVTLAEEIAALEPYLDIQRTRFEDWLRVDVRMGAGTEDALVPHLILQPLVENAIRHGLSVRPGQGHIEVTSERRGERLYLRVQDDGVGLARSREMQKGRKEGSGGIGLRNATERMRQLYGLDHRFELRDATDGGVVVELELPYRKGEATTPEEARRTMEREAGLLAIEDIHTWRTGEYSTSVAAYPSFERSPTPAVDHAPLPQWQASGSFRAVTPLSTTTSSASATTAGDGESSLTTSGTFPIDGGAPTWSPTMSRGAWLGIAALWVGLAVMWTYQMILFTASRRMTSEAGDIWRIAQLQIATSVIWIVLSPVVLWLARRFRLDGENWARRLPLHGAAALGSGFIHTGLIATSGLSDVPLLSVTNMNPLTGDFFVYFGLLAWSHSRDFVAWYRAREIDAARLSARIALSRFQSLRVQLRPQFLLTTLELLADLVHRDVPRAETLITRLADTLRLTLDLGREPTATVAQELDLLQACVESHRLGIRPGVQLELDVPTSALQLRIPSRLVCTMADELLASDAANPATPLTVRVEVERVHDTTRIRLQGDALWLGGRTDPHAWWRAKSVAEAAIVDAGPLVSLTFPDRATAVLIVADDTSVAGTESPPATSASLAGVGT